VQSDPVWARLARLAATLRIRSSWATPITQGDSDTAVGALELHFSDRRRASSADLNRLSAIAKLAAAVIERTRLAERLEQQSMRDSLTGLPNRFALEIGLEQSLLESAKRGSQLALLQIDLDGFRQFNDTLGHSIGDELLMAVAARWSPLLPSKDLLSRMGGDEFALIAHHLESDLEAMTLARQLLEAMRQPFELHGLELFLGASVGFAMYPEDGEDAVTLIRHADTAMNVVKRHGKNDVQRFRPQMNASAKERLELEVALRRALERDELEVYYQPQVNMAGAVVSLEALTYWNHPKDGVVGPARFIPIAEESGLIIPLGLWVLERSCLQIARWRREGLNVSLAVNVNVQQFLRADFAANVARVLKATNFEPRLLELELTESALMQDLDLAVERLMALRRLGVRVSIDDFGTGYSSLSYLQKLPVSAVKIDRSFVSHLEPNSSGWSMVNLIVMMARHLRLGVVAEGVETAAQFEALGDLAVDRAQGFLFARPTPAEKLYPHLKAGYPPQATG
jgi:diguanylate cyclase (GGDEF)-like protein